MANSNSEKKREAVTEGEQSIADSKSPPTIAHMLGEIVWVLAQSPAHKHFSLADLEWLVVPPLMLEQYRVFRDDKNAPIGVALWAFLDEAAEKQLNAEPGRLRPDQWKCGDRLWLVELVAPFATTQNSLYEKMIADLYEGPLGHRRFSFHTNSGGVRRVHTFPDRVDSSRDR